MALRPSQIRATSVDGALMIPGAVALRRGYKELTLPVVIIAGDGDKVVFKRRSERLQDSISGSVLQIIKDAMRASSRQHSVSAAEQSPEIPVMAQTSTFHYPSATPDFDRTLVMAIELSD